MAKPVVVIPPLNPIRLVPQLTFDGFYNTVPFDLQENEDCYFQKYRKVIETPLQFSALDSVNDLDLNLYDVLTGYLVKNYPAIPVDLTVLNADGYTYYETVISFTGLESGKYYLELTCTDPETDLPVLFQSDILDIQDEHPDCLLFEYRNSENEFSVIFETGVVFRLLVEATIEDYDFQFDDNTYIDEVHNPTKLSSIFYDKFTLYAPNIGGFIVPWMFKKIGAAMSCDSVRIDGVYYERPDGSKYEVQRAPRSKKLGLKIDIVHVENLFNKRIKTGDKPPGNFVIVQEVKNYPNQAANFQVNALFKRNSFLENIIVYNNNLTDYNINVGTTPNGSDIAIIEAKDWETESVVDSIVEECKIAFLGSETVYFSGLTGTDGLSLDITLLWKQLDKPAINLPFTFPDQLFKGFTARYKEINPGDIVTYFDLGTGLGIAGTQAEKWAFADGRNGGVDESGCVAVMFDPTNPDYAALDNKGGADVLYLTTAQLPEFFLKYRATKTTGIAQIEGNNLKNDDDRGLWLSNEEFETSRIGNNAPIDNRQRYIVGLTIIKIQD